MQKERIQINKERIGVLIEHTLSCIIEWVKIDDTGKLIFEDPIDKVEISVHYGASHAAVSIIIIGLQKKDYVLYKLGINLLHSILERWDENKKLPSFHFDFNNFALCVVYDVLKEKEPEISEKIMHTILSTVDSCHETINWLPMRWYVNAKKFQWTQNFKYKSIIEHCKSTINSATNNDGGIEDILPKGNSFNLQYDAATVGVLQFLRVNGENYDLTRQLGFLLNAIAPDGDINYQGRGTNQISAWSNWIYLLSTAAKENELKQALDYIYDKIPIMLSNHNIMLNSYDGSEKYLWWDYHHCSVYTAHFLFWLVLSYKDYGKNPIEEKYIRDYSTGLKIIKSENFFISIFEGRKKYLAEKGPLLVALWTKKYGMIVKGAFAPWLGSFGNNHTFSEIALRNFFGLLEVNYNRDWQIFRWIRIFFSFVMSRDSITYRPLLAQIYITFKENEVIIRFVNPKKRRVQINIPSLIPSINNFIIRADKKIINLYNVINIRNQYSTLKVFQSKPSKAKEWVITLIFN